MSSLSSKPRVLMITQYLAIGGLERMIFTLGCELKRQGEYEPHVFNYEALESSQFLHQQLIQYEIPVYAMRKARGFSWQVVRKIVETVKKNEIKILHTHNLGSLIYGALAKVCLFGRVKLIHTQHSFIHLKEKRRYAWYEKFFCKFVDALTVVSEDTASTYRRLGVPQEHISIVENGVDFPHEHVFSDAERKHSRQTLLYAFKDSPFHSKLSSHLEDHWLLNLARLHPEKGQRHVLSLWQELAPEIRKKTVLLIVGPESEAGELQRLQSQALQLPDEDRIIFTGIAPDPHIWLNACDVFISCSEFEGMPLGPLEAVGSGLPVVLSNIPGHQFLNNYARIFKLTELRTGAEQVAEAIREIEKDGEQLFRKLWENARPLIERFSLQTMAKRYSEIYHKLLE